jgi:hypothetical protein
VALPPVVYAMKTRGKRKRAVSRLLPGESVAAKRLQLLGTDCTEVMLHSSTNTTHSELYSLKA